MDVDISKVPTLKDIRGQGTKHITQITSMSK